MTHNFKDSFVYQSQSIVQNNNNISKIERFMQKIQVAKDISKINNIKNAITPHYQNILSMARQKLQLISSNS